MSKFSGKCDFYDHLFMTTDDENEAFKKFNGTKLYKYKKKENCIDVERIEDIHKNWEEIEYHSIKDLIPYYPYIICIAGIDNFDSKKSMVVLGSESYIDSREKDMMDFYLKDLIRIYNRCKRKKIEFNVDEAIKEVALICNKEQLRELAERVQKKGKKANYDGIHLESKNFYRKELLEEMKKNGLNPECYGYGEFLS